MYEQNTNDDNMKLYVRPANQMHFPDRYYSNILQRLQSCSTMIRVLDYIIILRYTQAEWKNQPHYNIQICHRLTFHNNLQKSYIILHKILIYNHCIF